MKSLAVSFRAWGPLAAISPISLEVRRLVAVHIKNIVWDQIVPIDSQVGAAAAPMRQG